MRWLGHYWKLFLDDVRHQKLRAFLTLFGIVWGSAAVTLLLAFGQGFHRQIEINFKGLGENIVIAWPARTSKPWNGLPKGRPIRMNEADIELMRQRVPVIAHISGERSIDGLRVKVGRDAVAPEIVGTEPEFTLMRNLIPQAGGRYLDALDLLHRRRTVFLGDKLAQNLFGEDGAKKAVGQHVQIDGIPFLVVGVMQKKNQDSSYSGRDEDKASIPLTTFRALYGQQHLDNVVFQVADPDDVEAAKESFVRVLAERYDFDPSDKEAVQMWDTTEQLKFLDAFFLGFNLFLGIVGALTLVVGGIGVSNIMNVVVEERTKEIGVKMALGARKRYVIGQFLFETLLLTGIGGTLGLGIAAGIARVMGMLPLTEFVGTPVISLQVAAITAVILGAIGFLAGWFPARTAANLNPVEALRL
jgi:putative ABC transport system permease protein